eukprot:1713339-Ditylum_brightwellii.AAC.1
MMLEKNKSGSCLVVEIQGVVTVGKEETEVTFHHVPFFSNASITMINENNNGGSVVLMEWEVIMLLQKSWQGGSRT